MVSGLSMKWVGVGVLALALGTWGAPAGDTPPAAPAAPSAARSLTVLTGYTECNLRRGQKDYELVPLLFRYPLWQARECPVTGYWGLNLEPYAGLVLAPDNNVEFGLPLFVRDTVPFGATGLAWFIEGGIGPMYMTQPVAEQSTKFNFIDQAGSGFRYALTASLDLEVEYRFRHVSNGGMHHPNSGINGHVGLVGVTYRY